MTRRDAHQTFLQNEVRELRIVMRRIAFAYTVEAARLDAQEALDETKFRALEFAAEYPLEVEAEARR